MEVIRLSGYTDREKAAIAQGYLIPRQIRENGLKTEEVDFSDEALQGIIRSYTREAGVRNLEREIGRVCRKVATKIAEGKADKIAITPDLVREFLGKPRFLGIEEVTERISLPGVATGLAYTQTGGDVLFIEATAMPGSKQFLLTGSLGQVMKESAQAALSHVRAMSDELAIPSEFWDTHDLHLHVPTGSQPKDGPSAGVTMAVALASLATGRHVLSNIGMTGEVTLRGKVLPVGGIKEKVLAAHRACLTTVLLPRRNEADLEDVPEEVRKEIKFIYIDTVSDAIDEALDGKAAKQRKRKRSTAAAKKDEKKPKRTKAQPEKKRKTSTSRTKKPSN
jgi:ATP-dependent Lon protease